MSTSHNTHSLLDSGNGRKLERFGPYVLDRPCAQAVWRPSLEKWEADARFDRPGGWEGKLPKEWEIELAGVEIRICPTDFGHVGVFPEHARFWPTLEAPRVLNLFAYSGGATLAAAKLGAQVCHVDASKGMVEWASDNARLNGLGKAPIRWIADDAIRFLRREVKRGRVYDGILLDPPSFGRGAKGEVFKIEEELPGLLDLCEAVLSDTPRFVILSCHTPGYTPLVLKNLMTQVFGENVTAGEMTLGENLPSGAFARWSC